MPVSKTTDSPPPHDLELVIDFVNTHDLETGTDELASTAALQGWLRTRELIAGARGTVTEDDRRQAVRLREALRALLLSHNGGVADPHAAEVLERTALDGKLSVQFAAAGSARLIARTDGFAGALARILIPVVEAEADGSWQRVKACRADECHWAFYDHSRNRSGVWCDMAVCGNRTKVRAYRSRKPGAGTGDG